MRALFFLGLFVLPVSIVQAQSAAVEALPPFLQSRVVDSDPLMNFHTQSVPQGRVDLDTGVLRAAYRLAPTVPLGVTHEATARAYFDAEAERFGWVTADDLLLVREIDGHYSAHLTFQQTFGGIPVHNRFVKVSMGQGGHPSMVISGYAPHLREAAPVRLQPLMDASGAVLRAQQETLTQGVSTPELVVYPSTPPRLAWQMIVSPDGIPAAWEMLMDADTGEIIYLRNQAMHRHTPSSLPARAAPLAPAEPAAVPAARAVVDGTGLVFDPDPLTSAGVLYGDLYVDNDDADVEELNAERKEVVLRDITLGADGLYRLIGPYVEISGDRNLGGRAWTPPAEADPNAFRYGRGNDFFEAVMVYYHVDKNQRYIQSLYVGRPIREFPFRVNPHGSGPGSGYSFSRDPERYSFGDQNVDGAEDADAILRLYAVALLLDSVPGILDSPEIYSIEDGWVYYWVASYSRGLVDAEEVPVPEVQSWRTIENWTNGDGSNTQIQVNFPVGDKHDPDLPNGGLWATTMMEIYDELGKRVTDRLILASHAYLGSSSILVDKAEALLQADEDLYAGEYESVLREKLVARGYLSADDTPLSVTLSVSPSRVAEDVGTAEVTVTATVDGGTFADAETMTVSVGTPGDGAEEGTDYGVVEDFVITIPGGFSSATGTFTLDPINDAIFEGSETVGVAGVPRGRVDDGNVIPTAITITDDDIRSTALLLTISPESVGEDAGMVNLEVTASLDAGASTEPISVTVSVTDGTAGLEDYSVSQGTVLLEIPAGALEVTGMVEVEILEDDLTEGDETIVIEASATGLTPASQDLVITANDASLSVTLGVSPAKVAENTATEVTVTAKVDGGTFAGLVAVTVSVGTSEDSAEEGTDYVAVENFTITIPGGSSSTKGTFTLAPVDDMIAEGDETLSVAGTLSDRTVTPAMVTITDDDVPSTALLLTVAPARLHENSGTSWVRFTAGLNNAALPMDTPVDVSVTDGMATAGADYSISAATSSITIPAGETSSSDSLQIIVTDDDAAEGNETVVIGVSATGFGATTQNLVIIDDEAAVRIDVLNVIAKEDGDYTVTATVRQNLGAPVTSVVLYYGDGMAFEEKPMQSLGSLYTAELMAPDEGGILYYYVVATNGDGLTARYPPDGRYWDISDYIIGSRLVFLDFENDDAGDKSAAGHYVAYKGGMPTFAEGALALDGLDDHAEILGSSLGVSEEFALELMFNADDFGAGTLDTGEGYLVVKPARCSTCWGESMFSLLWGEGSGNSGTYVAARFWNSEYEGEQIELEVPLSLARGQWYHAALEVQKKDAGQRAVLQLRDGSGQLYGEDAAVLPAPPTISRHPVFVGHIGDRGFFDGRIDDVAFYNYAHFALSLASAEDAWKVPEGYVLEQNYPNPFNPVTTIRYDLARVGHVRLEVSDLLGRRVALLVNEVQQAGAQEVRFDAGDLPSGMYLYRLQVGDFVSVKKMVLLK